jgi:hypothetical protein
MSDQKIELIVTQTLIGSKKQLKVNIDPSLQPLEVLNILTGVCNQLVGQLMQMQSGRPMISPEMLKKEQ